MTFTFWTVLDFVFELCTVVPPPGTTPASDVLYSFSDSDWDESNAALGGLERRPYFLPSTINFGDTSRDGDAVNDVSWFSSSSVRFSNCSKTKKKTIFWKKVNFIVIQNLLTKKWF